MARPPAPSVGSHQPSLTYLSSSRPWVVEHLEPSSSPLRPAAAVAVRAIAAAKEGRLKTRSLDEYHTAMGLGGAAAGPPPS